MLYYRCFSHLTRTLQRNDIIGRTTPFINEMKLALWFQLKNIEKCLMNDSVHLKVLRGIYFSRKLIITVKFVIVSG